MDLSNKSLAMLLLAAVVISLGGTIISLNKISKLQAGPVQTGVTGKATSSGTTELNVSTVVGCNVDTNVDFGTGAATNFDLTTDKNNSNFTGFQDCSDALGRSNCTGMEINNTGNVELNVSVNSSKNATGFLGGPDATATDFQFKMRNGTYDGSQAGCTNSTGALGWSGYKVMNKTTNETTKLVCANLTSATTSDMITMEYNVTLHTSTPSGKKTTDINVNCQQI